MTQESSQRIAKLKQRLADIAEGLARSGGGLALLGLGSAGLERERLDEWSDLDFFAIVEAGRKPAYLADLAWLEGGCRLSWRFANTKDGFKLLYEDGIFAEMAVFEPAELAAVPYSPGRLVWAREGFDRAMLEPRNTSGRAWTPPSIEHAAGELLSCLYVALCRFRRGEKLSAWRFAQVYCLDRFLELLEMLEPDAGRQGQDPYSRDRRFEARFPGEAERLGEFLRGYEGTPAAVLSLLAWLEERVGADAAMAKEIRRLAEG